MEWISASQWTWEPLEHLIDDDGESEFVRLYDAKLKQGRLSPVPLECPAFPEASAILWFILSLF